MYKFNDTTIDNRIQELIYSGESDRYTCNLNIEGTDISPSQIASIHISKPIIDTENEYFYIGSFISNQLTIKFRNMEGLTLESGNSVDLNIDMDLSSKNLANSSEQSHTFTASTNTTLNLGTIDLVAGTTYYYSYTIENNTSSNTRNTPFIQIDNTKTYEATNTNYNTEEGRKVWQFTPNTTGTYTFGYWCHTPNVDLTVSEFMISTSEDTSYEPYAGSTVTIPIGQFQIDNLAENYQETCEIVCLDNAVKFKPAIDYSACFTDGKATIATILNYICTYFNIELDANYPTINDNIEIGTYDSTVSGKQWISYIAEIKGCNAKIGRDGKLYLIPIKSSPVASINALKGKDWNVGEKYKISQVIYFDAIRNFTFGTDSDNTLFIRPDNPFVVNETAVSNIFNAVENTEIFNLMSENYGNITFDAGDTIEYTLGEDTYQTLHNGEITYEISIMGRNEVQIPTKEQEVTTNNLNSDIVNIKKIETQVDQLEGQVVINAENIQTTRDDLANNYLTTSQINYMIVNAESGITNTFSEAGGNNVLRNTRFFAQEVLEAGQEYEYWYGNVDRITNGNAANGFSILLKNGTLYQTQQVANGNYTLSFYYKKLIHLATCKVVINGNEYDLDQENQYTLFQTGVSKYYQTSDTTYQANVDYYTLEDDNYVLLVAGTDYEVGDPITDTVYNLDNIAPIQISSNQITIEFVSDTDDACEIYDIMLNAGQVKLAYSQNQNETVTNTVNISKGITITASDQNVKFIATPDGIRIKNKDTNQDVVFFTDTGMTTKNATIEDTAKIVGIHRQKVGDQIWDSMI